MLLRILLTLKIRSEERFQHRTKPQIRLLCLDVRSGGMADWPDRDARRSPRGKIGRAFEEAYNVHYLRRR